MTIHYGLEPLEDRISNLVDRKGWNENLAEGFECETPAVIDAEGGTE